TASSMGYDDQFYQALLLRNPALSDTTIRKLCAATNIPGESFGVVLAGQTHQMTAELVEDVITSSNFTTANYLDILADQWLTEDHYEVLIDGTLLDNEAIVTLIEEHYEKPTDASLITFINERTPSRS